MKSPLADRLRPKSLEELLGQEHLIGPGRPLRKAIEQGRIHSMIFFGPPGCGKTTLARLIAQTVKAEFFPFSAASSSINEIKKIIDQASDKKRMFGQETIIFIDEIHRFNRAQQDIFLPYVEKGTIILIGATTENPSFEINSSLLSRAKVYLLQPLAPEIIREIINRALNHPDGLGQLNIKIEPQALDFIITVSDGDARVALNILELASQTANASSIDLKLVEDIVQRKALRYDRAGEEHYNLISALHKSLRGGDVDAALYWLARMLEAGEDPLYIARRMVRFATEDIGNRDPFALVLAVAARDAIDFIGRPEGDLALAELAIYLALAPKSDETYTAYEEAKKDALQTYAEPVPLHLRNAPTRLMKEWGYGKGYKYPHDYPDAKVEQEYLPEGLKGKKYYK
ncbi:MAG: replication-associated recombination protein A, partial [candidate division WOR-3 bacterium]